MHGREIQIEKAIWKNFQIKKRKVAGKDVFETTVVGSCKQFPIKLAWVITVHKSQGLTFDSIEILNYKRVMTDALMYVALSRCRTMSGIRIYAPIQTSDIRVNERMLEFCATVWSRSQLDNFLQEIYDDFILQALTEVFTFEDFENYRLKHDLELYDSCSQVCIDRLLSFGWITEKAPGLYFNTRRREVDVQPVKKPRIKLAQSFDWK